MRLRLSPAHWQIIADHLAQWWPEEACGLLGGAAGVVETVHLVENQLHSPVAYQMAPDQQIETMLAIEAAGREVVGIFHSHPHGPPVPSASDIAQAYYPESVYVICVPAAQGWRGRAFRIVAGQVTELPLDIVEPAG